MSITRLRVLTPEALDAVAANLVNTPSSQLGTAVANKAGTGTPTTTGVVTATGNSLMQRDSAGRSQVATPSASADIATKGYVDTAVGGYILTSAKGANSGVASLDSTGKIPASQIAISFPRNLGSGTAYPGTKNTGDTFTHTGLNSLMRWDGAQWVQAGRSTVATRTARDTMLSTYSADIPLGFTTTQLDYHWIWRKDRIGWIYAGVEANNSIYPNEVNEGPTFMYQSLNQTVPFQTTTQIGGFSYLPAADASITDTEREIVTWDGTANKWTIHDRCVVSIVAFCYSSVPYAGSVLFMLNPPGGGNVIPIVISNLVHRGTANGYAGWSQLYQTLNHTGYSNKSSSFNLNVVQFNTGSAVATGMNFYVSIQILPG